jgi:hypothetical protein
LKKVVLPWALRWGCGRVLVCLVGADRKLQRGRNGLVLEKAASKAVQHARTLELFF